MDELMMCDKRMIHCRLQRTRNQNRFDIQATQAARLRSSSANNILRKHYTMGITLSYIRNTIQTARD